MYLLQEITLLGITERVESMTDNLKGFKDGVTDAILNGSVDDDNRHDYYKQGYDFGISLYAELMVNNDFFKEKRKSK